MSAALCWVIGDGHPPAKKISWLLDELQKHAEKTGYKLEERP